MKLSQLFQLSLGLVLATGASAQGVISRLGGYAENVAQVPEQAASPLSLFLQASPLAAAEPSYAVAGPMPTLATPPTATGPSYAVPAAGPGMSATLVEGVPPAELVAAPAKPESKSSFARPKGLLILRKMNVANPGVEGSKIFFGADSNFAMGTDSAGNFVVQEASAPEPLVSLDSAETLHLGSARVEALSLDAQNGLSVRGVKQWQLVSTEDFTSGAAGWNRPQVSECAGVAMLGGFCKFSKGEVNKTFAGLPPHKQLRVVATYHFIDRWIGESGFMKLSIGKSDCGTTVWSERYAQEEAKNGLSLCGDAGTPEGKFAVPVDVTVPHKKDSVTVTFGSTMDHADSCDESWGVSNVEIYIRD